MPLLDTIKQMQQQGVQDTEIVQKMQQQGYNPKEIDDALNQSRIKAAVSETYEQSGQESVMDNSQNLEMQPSVMSPEANTQPQTQEYVYPVEQQAQQPYAGEYYQSPQGVSPDTISEIAEQIVMEKFSEIKKSISNLADFKTVTDAKISNIDSRLKKIESTIEKLQSSIIGRVGEFGQAVEDIKSEMSMMQDSFGKVVNKAISNTPVREREIPRERIEERHEEQPQRQQEEHKEDQQEETSNQNEKMRESIMGNERKNQPRAKKSRDGFENYLR